MEEGRLEISARNKKEVVYRLHRTYQLHYPGSLNMAPVRRRVRGGQAAGTTAAAKTAKEEAAIKEREVESDEE